jgi:hypothetical protein
VEKIKRDGTKVIIGVGNWGFERKTWIAATVRILADRLGDSGSKERIITRRIWRDAYRLNNADDLTVQRWYNRCIHWGKYGN